MLPVENTSHIAAWYYCQQGKMPHFNPNFWTGYDQEPRYCNHAIDYRSKDKHKSQY